MRRIAEEMDDRRRLARSLARQGALLLDAGKHAAARRELGRALETARAAGDKVTEAEALRIDATLLMNTGSYADALDHTRAALAALEGLDDRAALRERAQSLHALGNIEFDQGRGESARTAYSEAVQIYRRLGTRRLESATLNNLGNVANSLGEFEQAIDHYKQSLKIDQEIGDRLGIGATLGNVGQTYAMVGDLDRARRYLGKALALDEASGDLGGLTDATIGLGQVFLRLGDAQSAAERLERGLELAQEQRNRYQEIRALIYLAFCKLAAGARDEGPLDLARSAVKLAREAQIANGLCFGLLAQARALERLGRLAEAAERSAEAVATVDGGKVVDEVEEIFFTHAELARAAGREGEARAALERAAREVQGKAERMRDESWRRQYLAWTPAAAILARAREAGLVPGAV
jgi:tetratricopeptide (TPR) repeat protein